jgi:plasmid stabilization system protein ParE
MAGVEVTPEAQADLERLFELIAERDPALARKRLVSVRQALNLLGDHSLMGRQADGGQRELILLRGRAAYIARYFYLPSEDVVFVLRVRDQHEAGNPDDAYLGNQLIYAYLPETFRDSLADFAGAS